MCIERPGAGRQAGVTLIELVVFMVVISVGVAGILSVFQLVVGRSADPLPRKQALAIADGLMEEILAAGFTWCDGADPNLETAASAAGCTTAEAIGPEAGNARPYDNVNDYNGLTLAAVTDLSNTIAGPAGYTASVTVANATIGPAGSTVGGGGALLVTVTVSDPFGGSVALQGVRTRYDPNGRP
ncbi:MAG TPA: prepilin-type N-terminal cleavage/methylation domain-containing protein [Rhodocyclaceae bacterium]|nr:prepilin-type N-terminal cleavage/methylation domain-containing protein [Rhodocyclaceae bacterium]HNH35085.1 prepilin-type N-terminal cleavage/methylation domain-containing protein [Rhodocyclaceae bacterium]